METGGYKAISFNHKDLKTTQYFLGIYERLEGNRKPILVENLVYDGTEYYNMFFDVFVENSNFVLINDKLKITITVEDSVICEKKAEPVTPKKYYHYYIYLGNSDFSSEGDYWSDYKIAFDFYTSIDIQVLDDLETYSDNKDIFLEHVNQIVNTDLVNGVGIAHSKNNDTVYYTFSMINEGDKSYIWIGYDIDTDGEYIYQNGIEYCNIKKYEM